jgi:hypothetical protein
MSPCLASGSDAVQRGGAAAKALNLDNLHSPGITLGGQISLCGCADGLGNNQGHRRTENGQGQSAQAIAPPSLIGAKQRKEGNRSCEQP